MNWFKKLFSKRNLPEAIPLPEGSPVTSDYLKSMLLSIDDKARVDKWDAGPFRTIPWRDMARLYKTVPALPVWKKDVWNCNKIARFTAAWINKVWAEMGGTMPLAHGVIHGMVPLDGNSFESGPHSLCWFYAEDLKFWLYGSIERSIKNQSENGLIKKVYEFSVGG